MEIENIVEKERISKIWDEEVLETIEELISKKIVYGLTWQGIADRIFDSYNVDRSEKWYRDYAKKFSIEIIDPTEDENYEVEGITEETIEDEYDDIDEEAILKALKLEVQKEKVKLSDERIQNNAYIRAMAREETLKEIAADFADKMNKEKVLKDYESHFCVGDTSAILQLSDWHFGMEIDSYFNKYNPEIAVQRLEKLKNQVIEKCQKNNVQTLYVVNLSDLIAGRIHLQIRLQSRFDVIDQVMKVSELLAEFLTQLSKHFNVEYYDCLDNHSRLEPNKALSMKLESLSRIVTWYLKDRQLNDNINIHTNNTYGMDIIDFNIGKFNILGVHGDIDKPATIVKTLTTYTQKHYDMILTAHYHHFSADEENNTLVISNGSLMGTDTYAQDLRLTSAPSQNLIIVSDNNVCECIYRINLNCQ